MILFYLILALVAAAAAVADIFCRFIVVVVAIRTWPFFVFARVSLCCVCV